MAWRWPITAAGRPRDRIPASGIDRDDIFITSKLNNGFHEPDAAFAAFDRTLADLAAMDRMLTTVRVRAIGVSNFQPAHLRRVVAGASVVPAVNQIEIHPYLTQDDVRAVDAELGIATEAWSPIVAVAQRVDRTPARVEETSGCSTSSCPPPTWPRSPA